MLCRLCYSHYRRSLSPEFLRNATTPQYSRTFTVTPAKYTVIQPIIYFINNMTRSGYCLFHVPSKNTSRSFPHSRFITGFVTRLTRRVPLVEQELLTLSEHLSSPPVFSGVRVARSLVLFYMYVL